MESAKHLVLVEQAAAGLKIDLSADISANLVAFLDLVRSWNAKIDLTAARSAEELTDLMLADALFLSRHLPEGARVVDVGSGAGAPGLPLAMLRPDLELTLVEPLQKRVAFMRTVIGTRWPTAVRRPRVERARGEDLVGRGDGFDVAISRATLAPSSWLALGARLASESVWVLLAREEPPALPGWSLTHDEAYRWPLTHAQRRAVGYGPEETA